MKRNRKIISMCLLSFFSLMLSACGQSFLPAGPENNSSSEATGEQGKDGLTPYIGTNGNWWIGDTDTGISASGEKGEPGEPGEPGEKGEPGQDGLTPYIGTNGNWWIGDTDTGVTAVGQGTPGKDGTDGKDGLTPYIGSNGNWWIGDTDTGVTAIGQAKPGEDGLTPFIGSNGNWWIGDTDTGVSATGNTGIQGEQGEQGEKGDKGDIGKSAFDIFKENYPDYPYNEAQWIYDLGHGRLGEHTFWLDNNGGQLPSGTQTYYPNQYYYKSLILTLPTPSLNRYQFEGWYDIYSGQYYQAGITYSFTVDRDITLQARWKYIGSNIEIPASYDVSSEFDFDHSAIYYGDDIYSYVEDDVYGGIAISGLNDNYDHQTYLAIPAQIDGKNVTSIRARSFYQNQTISYVSIPNTVQEIGQYAFAETYLKEIDFTNASNLRQISKYAFYYSLVCNLTEFSDLQNLVSIGDYAFGHTKIPGLLLKDMSSLYSIGYNAFSFCNSIKTICIDNCDSLEVFGGASFFGCSYLIKAAIINCSSLVILGNSIFSECCSLVEADISNNEKLNLFENGVFYNCLSLETIFLFNNPSLVSFGYDSFKDCNHLSDIYYSGSKEQWEAINGNEIDSENFALAIANVHFNSVSIYYIDGKVGYPIDSTAPETLSYELNKSGDGYIITGWGTYTGSEVYLGGTFNGLPITEIAPYAFANSPFTKIYVDESIVTIDTCAFAGCDSLLEIYFFSEVVPYFVNDTFQSTWNNNDTFRIYVPLASVSLYKYVTTDQYWNTYATDNVYGKNVAALREEYVFSKVIDWFDTSDDTYTLMTPSAEGFEFLGWYYDEELTEPVTQLTFHPTENQTFYAKWRKLP